MIEKFQALQRAFLDIEDEEKLLVYEEHKNENQSPPKKRVEESTRDGNAETPVKLREGTSKRPMQDIATNTDGAKPVILEAPRRTDPGNKQQRWSAMVSDDVLLTISNEEKKRQQIIFELYHTERNHVKTLKILDTVFKPILQKSGVIKQKLLDSLFPQSLQTLHDLHLRFQVFLKDRVEDKNFMAGEIGDILVKMFCGFSGRELQMEVSAICWTQQKALHKLEDKRKTDSSLNKVLCQAEAHEACHFLKCEHLLPTVWQRLTKYPLLFDNLLKATSVVLSNNQKEIDAIKKALDASKEILEHVNLSIKGSEDKEK